MVTDSRSFPRGGERGDERRVRGLRGRVKGARTVVANTPGLAETLQSDGQKAAEFYAAINVPPETDLSRRELGERYR